tara:strand:+ start:632 stop:1402 length:771 start_codon:yes stop_codon:yes gene_type:complete
MPKVVYTPLSPNTAPTGEEVYDNFYSLDAGVATSSLAVVNGFLDADNLDSIGNRELDYNYLQKNSVSGGGMVGGTANLDYFSTRATASALAPAIDGVFSGVSDPETAGAGNFIAIPGGSVQFYLPYKAFVLLTWQVTFTNDSTGVEKESHIRLFLDGQRVGPNGNKDNACNVRRVRRTMFAASSSGGSTLRQTVRLRDRYKGRYWSGHQWIPLPGDQPLRKGFHSASLRVIQHGDVKQTRVRARSMKYIFFKASDD